MVCPQNSTAVRGRSPGRTGTRSKITQHRLGGWIHCQTHHRDVLYKKQKKNQQDASLSLLPLKLLQPVTAASNSGLVEFMAHSRCWMEPHLAGRPEECWDGGRGPRLATGGEGGEDMCRTLLPKPATSMCAELWRSCLI